MTGIRLPLPLLASATLAGGLLMTSLRTDRWAWLTFGLAVAAGWLTYARVGRHQGFGLSGAIAAAALMACVWLAVSPESDVHGLGWGLTVAAVLMNLALLVYVRISRGQVGQVGRDTLLSSPSDDRSGGGFLGD